MIKKVKEVMQDENGNPYKVIICPFCTKVIFMERGEKKTI